jgi:hypothetical protein
MIDESVKKRCFKALRGQSAPEFALVAALIVLAAGSSLGPVKEAIENQGKLSAQSISSDGLEVSGTECLRVGGGGASQSNAGQCLGGGGRSE